MKDFVDEHWRDLVGIGVLYTGVAITLINPEAALGQSLAMAGLATLKLTTKTNGGTNVQP